MANSVIADSNNSEIVDEKEDIDMVKLDFKNLGLDKSVPNVTVTPFWEFWLTPSPLPFIR